MSTMEYQTDLFLIRTSILTYSCHQNQVLIDLLDPRLKGMKESSQALVTEQAETVLSLLSNLISNLMANTLLLLDSLRKCRQSQNSKLEMQCIKLLLDRTGQVTNLVSLSYSASYSSSPWDFSSSSYLRPWPDVVQLGEIEEQSMREIQYRQKGY